MSSEEARLYQLLIDKYKIPFRIFKGALFDKNNTPVSPWAVGDIFGLYVEKEREEILNNLILEKLTRENESLSVAKTKTDFAAE